MHAVGDCALSPRGSIAHYRPVGISLLAPIARMHNLSREVWSRSFASSALAASPSALVAPPLHVIPGSSGWCLSRGRLPRWYASARPAPPFGMCVRTPCPPLRVAENNYILARLLNMGNILSLHTGSPGRVIVSDPRAPLPKRSRPMRLPGEAPLMLRHGRSASTASTTTASTLPAAPRVSTLRSSCRMMSSPPALAWRFVATPTCTVMARH